MRNYHFQSALADRFGDYLTLRHSAGFEMRSQGYTLVKLDRILQQHISISGPITREIVEVFLSNLDGLQPGTRRNQLSTVRQFLLYFHQFEPKTFVPDGLFMPAGSASKAPYIYTDQEIKRLLVEAMHYPSRYPGRRWLLYHSLLAFLYVSAMRISEALALTLGDIDMKRRLVYIRKTKFHKARIVPLTKSACNGLKRYLTERAGKGYATTLDSPVFINQLGLPLSQSTVQHAFITIRRAADLRGGPGTRSPRIHDLRHTAAVKRLYLWYLEGKNVQALLPVLTTYLGHSDIRSTEVYLNTTAELLQAASDRFEKHYDLDT